MECEIKGCKEPAEKFGSIMEIPIYYCPKHSKQMYKTFQKHLFPKYWRRKDKDG